MNNFGVIELASTTTKTTPGWAYVPDTAPVLSSAVPSNRKRAARNQPGLSLADLSAREETRIRKDLEVLDRDNNKDVNIPIPPRSGGGSRAQTKYTPNVRKILQSQKTFANHLDDYRAMLALAESNPVAAAALSAAAQTKPSTPTAAASKSASPAPTPVPASAPSKRSAAAAKRAAAKEKQEQERKKARPTPKPAPEPEQEPDQTTQQPGAHQTDDIDMPDADADANANPDPTTTAQPTAEPTPPSPPRTYPRESAILPPYAKPPPPSHPGDDDPLLVSAVPPFPADDELRALMTAPPLSYLEARAVWGGGGDESRYPVRVFCAVCGYWGRVKCLKCGTRVCALDCLETHREECVTRYGL